MVRLVSFIHRIYFVALTGMEVEDKDVFSDDDEVMNCKATCTMV